MRHEITNIAVEPDKFLPGPVEGFAPTRFGRQLYARQAFAQFDAARSRSFQAGLYPNPAPTMPEQYFIGDPE